MDSTKDARSRSGLFIAQRAALETFIDTLQRLDPLSKVYSYLNDNYIVVAREHRLQ